jgi:8-oxo-dGTP pyrophosphatase MutT (NUDIX family)
MHRSIIRRNFDESHVRTEWTASTRVIVPEVERLIEEAWHRTKSRPGVNLFDGAVARCESIVVEHDVLRIALSRTSYRIVVGTNFENPHLGDTFGPQVMAYPLGVSAGVISSDGYLVYGRRNASVAYYPSRVHPFAGSLEVRDSVNLFDDVRRELREELNFTPGDIESITCIGVVEDTQMRHPETAYLVRTPRTLEAIRATMDREEHASLWHVSLDRLSDAMKDESLTPFARAIVERLLESPA